MKYLEINEISKIIIVGMRLRVRGETGAE